MKVIVTGGAGFIGSCIVRQLNERGITDIIIVDNIASTEKWKNLVNKKYTDYYNRSEFFDNISNFKDVSYVIHMGACSATTELNFDYLYKNNFEYTKKLWEFCSMNSINFIYASSAATYGDGLYGFDDENDITKLEALNGYGYSKQLFDIWQEKQIKRPPQWVGLKFFNVYGPNEYYKGKMASVVMHGYKSIKETGMLNLFKSCRYDYKDGGQKRDFIYVKDICNVINFIMDNHDVSGLFNLGTGESRTFLDLGISVFKALNMENNINFIPMPKDIQKKYQYFTEAKMNKLRKAGYNKKFYSLEDGIKDYVKNYLEKDFLTY